MKLELIIKNIINQVNIIYFIIGAQIQYDFVLNKRYITVKVNS